MDDKIKLDAKKCVAYAWVNLDEDGTPLTLHGERMFEVEPGVWEDPLVAWALGHIEKDDEAANP